MQSVIVRGTGKFFITEIGMTKLTGKLALWNNASFQNPGAAAWIMKIFFDFELFGF